MLGSQRPLSDDSQQPVKRGFSVRESVHQGSKLSARPVKILKKHLQAGKHRPQLVLQG